LRQIIFQIAKRRLRVIQLRICLPAIALLFGIARPQKSTTAAVPPQQSLPLPILQEDRFQVMQHADQNVVRMRDLQIGNSGDTLGVVATRQIRFVPFFQLLA
jgi:hypothetical protein